MEKGKEEKGVLVWSGCHSKILQTRWLTNNRHLFLSVLNGGWEVQDRGAGRLGVWRFHFLIDDCLLTVTCSCLGRRKGAVSGLFYSSTDPIYVSSTSWPNHLTTASSPDTTDLDVKFQHEDLGETPTFTPVQKGRKEEKGKSWKWLLPCAKPALSISPCIISFCFPRHFCHVELLRASVPCRLKLERWLWRLTIIYS